MEELLCYFNDSVLFNAEQKTAISVRDGVLTYLGAEIGALPHDKVFTVYRSPATIAKAKDLIVGLPITDDHTDLDAPVVNPISTVLSAEVIDFLDENTESYLAIKTTIAFTDQLKTVIASGTSEQSLGYKGKLVPHSKYDFEQKDIIPHHIAVVPRGRCGPRCSFLDKKTIETKNKENEKVGKKLAKIFLDADGLPNLQQIVEIAQQLPEALKTVPMDKLQEIMPVLQEIIAMAGGASGSGEPTHPVDGDDKTGVVDGEKKDVPVTDSEEFKDALSSALNRHAEVIEKAKNFVDESYVFSGKTTDQIMRDALRVEHGSQNFADAELSVAFKLLKKTSSNLTSFGDHSHAGLVERVKKAAKGEN